MEYLFLALLFIIAFLYSSVGHGGASGYLALMALFDMAHVIMKPSALSLNIFVAGIAFFAFYRAGYFRWRLAWPFLITSVPMAFIGALLPVNGNLYEIILGIFLLIAVARILFSPSALTDKPTLPPIAAAVITGALLGFFSGMTGIGGGIILSPLLILFHWSTVKESAAVSSLFILLNSASGLMATLIDGFRFNPQIILWIGIGISGALAGSYIGSKKLKQGKLKYILAAILFMASVKLIIF
ncbi:MAG TPA: sulfite exporter TauE/SafE family protein [Bacteroidales bacterium]|jgi:hypothetical protein|nr:sulfite exporter TauE/SafE family protein [Bacteroidales bacterium]